MITQYVLDDNSSQDGCIDVYRVDVDESDAAHMGAAQRHRKTCEYSRRVATYRCGSVYSDVLHLYGITNREDIDQVKRALSRYYESSAKALVH